MNIKLVKSKSIDSKFLYALRNSFEIRAASIKKKNIFKRTYKMVFINKKK